jgi:hypothetical protein
MFEWTKLGKLFDPADHVTAGWMKAFAQSPSAVVLEDRVRVYFCSRPEPDNEGQYLSYIAFVDLDRGDLFRVIGVSESPILSLGALGTFDEFGTNPVSVVRHREEVRAYYAGWTRCESVPFNAAIGVAVSRNDGESFARLGSGPVLSYSPDEPFLIGSPRVRLFADTWYLWYAAGKEWLPTLGKPEPVYKIRMATSGDGLKWRKAGRDLIESRLGVHECQAGADVTLLDGRYHMFFSYRRGEDYKGSEGSYRIGYAFSDDRLEWSRRDEMAGIDVSDSGWDSETVSYPHVFSLDGDTYMLYQGNGMGRTGFGLARLDGFRGHPAG